MAAHYRLKLPGGRHFELRLWPTLLMLALLPPLLWLGFWQLERAEQKRQLLAERAAQQAAPAVNLAELAGTGTPSGRLVRLAGQFDAEHILLVDHRSRQGRPGVEVLQAFLDQPSGRWVLVNRGWLPWPDRSELPTVSTPSGQVRLTARIHAADRRDLPLAGRAADGWPRLIYRIDPARIWALLGRSGVGYELRQASGPGRFDTDWPTHTLRPAQHLGYAVQWFAMAAAVVGLWLFIGLHGASRQTNPGPSGPLLESRR